MNIVEKLYSIIILTAVFIGLVIGQFEIIKSHANWLIFPLLLVMLYFTFISIPLKSIKKSSQNRKFTFTSLVINFVWTPVFAWGLASLFLSDHPALAIGFIMLMVTPCTDWYLIFTGIAKGNTPLSASILPINLLLQLLLLPFYLFVFSGTAGFVDFSILAESILLVLLLPLLLAVITNTFFPGPLKEKIQSMAVNTPIVFLSLAIAAMFASNGHLLLEHLDLLWKLTLPVLVFFAVNFLAGLKVGSVMKFAYQDKVSLSLTTLARNSPIALAVALTAFPGEPFIALTLIIGPLLELPLLAGISQLLLLTRKY
ncbi:arsenic resistance protein [Alteribacillus bidgolensis]|uniref:Arsenite efflux pump ArsB, ACR3 family n=1 Tax=Alteribacillus bidgolensis TaxID=930129 RepID=A0A1G8MGI7_9BACI|nr:arsenic resistance protein [Alteribacillus bidgolensis]SDI66917.1 Arsenite efflux pump ArsB, ACR3 family [Alteribacillus bidgolensis]